MEIISSRSIRDSVRVSFDDLELITLNGGTRRTQF